MSLRVLVVDDDPDLRLLIRLSLERVGGMAVEAVADGAAALESGRARRPDLLLLDVTMAGVTGPETLRLWRADESLRDVPAVFLTANVDDDVVADLRACGAVDVLAKPFDPRTLAQRLTALLAAHRGSLAR